MQTLELSQEEMELLRELLQHAAGEMDHELYRTDTRDFKVMLKHRQEVLARILARVPAAPMTAAA